MALTTGIAAKDKEDRGSPSGATTMPFDGSTARFCLAEEIAFTDILSLDNCGLGSAGLTGRIVSDDALSVLVPILEDIDGYLVPLLNHAPCSSKSVRI